MDILFIHDIKVKTVIGVYPWEKQVLQTLFLDLELGTDAAKAALTDELAATIDYTLIVTSLIEHLRNNSYQLIETLAERIAQLILTDFPVTWLRLKIRKPGVLPEAKEVGIIIERKREG
jgi:dihydroneopterin aldolase